MSGICVMATFDGAPVEGAQIKAMLSETPHRGPVTRRWDADGVVLVRQGHGVGGSPDVGGADVDDVVVLADARVDNRDELLMSLRRVGRPFAADGPRGVGTTVSDARLIGHAYRQWGPAFVERLIGDFALVVWDRQRRRLIAACDPMGMRSLYYRLESRRRVVLATEAKQILALPSVSRRVNERAVGAFLATTCELEGDESYWQGVAQLEAGHVLVVDRTGKFRRKYWKIDPQHRLFPRDEETAAEHLRQILTEAVAARLRGATGVGILLSGGLDSGSAAAIAGKLTTESHVHPTRLSAYSWAFDQLPQCDERHISGHIVRRFGIRTVDLPADDLGPLAGYPAHDVDRDDPMVGAFQPIIEHSLKRARDDQVSVMLGGDRGDLLFGITGVSYLRIAEAGQWAALVSEVREHRQTLPDPLTTIIRRHLFRALVGRLRKRNPGDWLRWTARRIGAHLPGHTPSSSTPPWIRPSFAARLAIGDTPTSLAVPDALGFTRAARFRLIFEPLHMRGMAWSERTYSRYGISFADPYSDRRLVEFVLALPQAMINRPGDVSKPLLRRAMRQTMPEPARVAATKIIPMPLFERGLRRGHDVVRALLTDSRAEERGWLDAAALSRHYDAWLAGCSLDSAFWYALSVERWLRAQERV